MSSIRRSYILSQSDCHAHLFRWLARRGNPMPQAHPTPFRHMLDILPVPACFLDPAAKRVVGANRDFCRLVGYMEHEILELPCQEIFPPEHSSGIETCICEFCERKSLQTWPLRQQDGSTLDF